MLKLIPFLSFLILMAFNELALSSFEERIEGVMMDSFDLLGGFDYDSSSYNKMVVDVEDYGAKGDGRDDSEAFDKAWRVACSSSKPVTFMVANDKNYKLKPLTFQGPCKSNVKVMIEGSIEASSDRSDWDGKNQRHWLLFDEINDLEVGGGGTINGNGNIWWQNSCKIKKSLPCHDAPTAMTFSKCKNLKVNELSIKNSQQIHISFERCSNVQASQLSISSPESSPNTDGIHVTGTQNINISNCVIQTGDDCISIVSGSQAVTVMDITCGPGHGISIGSLGSHNSEDHVSDVLVDTAKLTNTTNGVRIKTWQGGSGYAKHIIFQNINMKNVKNPIIIDQNYCDSTKPCDEQKSAVEVSNILYKNIKGTSASEIAIDFECSKSVPCHDIVLQDINLVKEGGGTAKSSCKNVEWTKKGQALPNPCDAN
ncbi:Polygalacturonase protein [Dioscorea alata]|uniref:Polygalacturonase protein n=1 Tax=Dioscorea alata TaxID=55571 RepID=A0ACB7UMS3_DIOAL|nr:Polygalacturonase protein [Dioscorea alata]